MIKNKIYTFLPESNASYGDKITKIHFIRFGEKKTLCGLNASFTGVYGEEEITKKWFGQHKIDFSFCLKCVTHCKKSLKL